jgi:hypothetical protein
MFTAYMAAYFFIQKDNLLARNIHINVDGLLLVQREPLSILLLDCQSAPLFPKNSLRMFRAARCTSAMVTK